MRRAATGFMAIVSAGSLTVAGILAVVGVLDSAGPLSGIYFFMAAGAAIIAGLSAVTARGLWRDRAWAWAILGLLGLLLAFAAWQINQGYYGDGALLSLTPITPYLAAIAAIGLALMALVIARAYGRRGVKPSSSA